jgi:pimeloyl-ACP methyl ester carboxylesterase
MGLGKAVAAEICTFSVAGGTQLRCYRSQPDNPDGNTRPLILLHSINAAPSAMEMKPLFERCADSRVVYAPDLPGFGQSQRGDLPYSPNFYAQVISDFLQQVDGLAPDVIALSLTSEFTARALRDNGAEIHSLTLISPTGLGRRQPPSAEVGARINRILNIGWLSRGLWRALVTRRSIQYFLNKAFYGPVPKAMVDYAVATTREPDAARAPFAFLTMQLFTTDALVLLYQPLKVPTLLLYDQDPNIGFECVPDLLRSNDLISAQTIVPTCGLPHWERPEETFSALTRFWGESE